MTNNILHIPIKILESGQKIDVPSYATDGSAGMDLRAAISNDVLIKKGERKLIPTGIVIAIPAGYNAEIRPRSGLAYNHGITVLNSPGTIDSDYRGEIKVLLINLGDKDFVFERGMRVAQMVVQKYEFISWKLSDSLDETSRSEGGYGSTGIN